MHHWVRCQMDMADMPAHKRQRGHGLCRNGGLMSAHRGRLNTGGNLGCDLVRV
jgi:hypothetical protein